MEEYLDSIRYLEISRTWRKIQSFECPEVGLNKYLQLTGSLNCISRSVIPQAAFAESHLQHVIGSLPVFNLVTANTVLQIMKTLKPKAVLRSLTQLENPAYLVFCDVSQGSLSYCQTGYISGLYLTWGRKFHMLSWQSSEQTRVAFSSNGTKSLAAATFTDLGS